ncbi:MAG TPA: glycosyltransferase family 4 protein [Candidatus Limnocylindrales bacterium]|nr:glycosyltransferase family 4 protein [Candidatus Limnocylindrales bacterium]
MSFALAGYALLRGSRPRGDGLSTYHEPRINRVAFNRAESALDAGDLETALERARELAHAHPDSIRVLRLRRDIESKQGELSAQARTLHRIQVLDPSPETLRAERMLLGRIVETSAGWLPRIPGPARPVVPHDGVVLNLLKESLPYLTNGFTMRSRYNLLAVRDAGMQPHVVTNLGFPRLLGGSVASPVPAVEMVDGVPHHRLDLGPNHLPGDRPFDVVLEEQAWLTAAIARQIAPSIIHAGSGHRGYETALVGAALRAHIRRPLVYEVRSFFESTWSADAQWNERGEQYHRRHNAETAAMRGADHVVTIAEAMRDDIIARGVDPDRVTVIPNGVDAEAFTPGPPDPALRRRYGLEGRFTFGYVSNLDHPRENQELLVEATAILLKRGRAVTCLIIGDGKRRAEIEGIAKKAGVGDRVIFTGRVPHEAVPSHYALLDAFVVPRRDERAARTVTPLKPYEALAMERPLVVADLPALTEIAEPDARGLAFPAGDAAALATALERLIDDPALGRRMGVAGREWVARERSWIANGPRFRTVYDQVLERWDRTSSGDGG